ncbi:hypothetical protein ACS0Y6_14110 [Burkholderia gladioli]|uniref:hypothetical protein n=1 Tax=Burkholderia gladioli TaxID=28095 RepID=UPI00069E9F65
MQDHQEAGSQAAPRQVDSVSANPESVSRRQAIAGLGFFGAAMSALVGNRAWGHEGVQGSFGWVCTPGNENRIGDPPMCVDRIGMQWFKDIHDRKPRPSITTPGLCYMLCGATQHSNSDALDTTSPAIPIGPHWMVLWPFDAAHCGLPTDVRDAGAWIMFAGTPYAYLHVCGSPWVGNSYTPGDCAVWTMHYAKSND